MITAIDAWISGHAKKCTVGGVIAGALLDRFGGDLVRWAVALL